jgi:hypothetical protein
MSIRKEISRILNYTITKDEYGARWEEAFKDLEVEGRITMKHILKILVVLLKAEEKRENE